MGFVVPGDHGLNSTYSAEDVLSYIERAVEDVGWRCRTVRRNGGTRTYISGRLAHALHMDKHFARTFLDMGEEVTLLPFGEDCQDEKKLKTIEANVINYMKSRAQKLEIRQSEAYAVVF